jgi:putative transposase
LSEIIGAFKSLPTNAYIKGVRNDGWKPFEKTLWQRNYFEHIIRDEDELNRIRQYIIDNPVQWVLDNENPDHHT